MSRRLRAFWLAIAGFALLCYAADRAQSNSLRLSVAALDAGEVAASAGASGTPASDFWERAKAMGVGAMAVRRQSLGALSERGQILLFTRPELEKWKSLGLIAPAAALQPNAVWVKDSRLLARLTATLSAQGLVRSTAVFSGHGIIELVREPKPEIPGVLDPDDLALASSLGLTPVELEPSGLWARVVPADGQVAAGAFGDGARVVAARAFEPSVRLAALLRAVHSRPGRLLLLRLDPAAASEDSLARLRAVLRPLREAGLVGREASAVPSRREENGWPLPAWRRWLAWLLAVLGPIFAVRLGVKCFKGARVGVLERRPAASPVAELLVGTAATASAAATMGICVGLLLDGSSTATLPESLALSTMAWPLAIGLLALFPPSPRLVERKLRAVPSYLDLLQLALVGAGAVLLFQPRLILSGTPVWGWLQGTQDAWPCLWWWPWRWREVLVGVPALLHGLYLVGRRGDAAADPRPWLWLGLLLPIGTIGAIGRPGAEVLFTLACSGLVLLAGLAVGGCPLIVRTHWAHRDQRPSCQ